MRLLLTVMLCLAFGSCASYQYLTLSSDQLSKNERKELTWENDSLMLSFNFNGGWGQFSITAMNKTNQPVSISWVKSAVVYEAKAYSFADESIRIEGEIQRNQLYAARSGVPAQSSTLQAGAQLPRGMDFMPPNSAVTRQHINISKLAPMTETLTEDLPAQKATDNGLTVTYRTKNYDAFSSPVKFSLYLTFVTTDGREFYFNQPFYVSAISQSAGGLHQVLINADGDKFYWKLLPQAPVD